MEHRINYEENMKHRNIGNYEKRKTRKQYERNIVDKCKADHKIFLNM